MEPGRRYVVGFVFTHDYHHVWLIQKNRPEWQAGKVNGVGGKIEEGESAFKAMTREFYEEAGLHITNWAHFAIVTDRDETWRLWCFGTTLDESMAEPRSMTDEKLVLFPTGRPLPGCVIPNLNFLIPMALRSNQQDWPYSIKQFC
jgi:8-oxo-dGTP diphosphatase